MLMFENLYLERRYDRNNNYLNYKKKTGTQRIKFSQSMETRNPSRINNAFSREN
jgi:hypothetical protein